MDYLARNQGRVFTRDQLLDAVWGEMQFVTPRSVDACIRRIREKIEPDSTRPTYLKTIRGVGYRLDSAASGRGIVPKYGSLAMPPISLACKAEV
jgi:DNA-binding response OmpR family regulator